MIDCYSKQRIFLASARGKQSIHSRHGGPLYKGKKRDPQKRETAAGNAPARAKRSTFSQGASTASEEETEEDGWPRVLRRRRRLDLSPSERRRRFSLSPFPHPFVQSLHSQALPPLVPSVAIQLLTRVRLSVVPLPNQPAYRAAAAGPDSGFSLLWL